MGGRSAPRRAGHWLGQDPTALLRPVKRGGGSYTLPLASKQSGGDWENFPVFTKSERFALSCLSCVLCGYLHLCACPRAGFPAGDLLGPLGIQFRGSPVQRRAAHVLGPIRL